MGFIANFKAKRAAKRAKAVYELELYEWNQENQVLNQALEIFTNASAGPPLEPPCAVGVVGTKQAKGLNA